MPLLTIELFKNKKKEKKGYTSSFGRNLHERTDMPVFTVEDAIKQIKNQELNKSDLEWEMDEWFINNIPCDIVMCEGDPN